MACSGDLLFEMSRIKEAEDNLKYAIKLKKNYHEAYNNLGKLLQETNRLKDSERNLRKALSIKDDIPASNYLLGITLFKLKKFNEAEIFFKRAILLENNKSDYFNSLGMVFVEQNKIDKALQNYEKALEQWHRAGELGDAQAHCNIGYSYMGGEGVAFDEEMAVHYYEIAAIRGNERARHNLGIVEEKAGGTI